MINEVERPLRPDQSGFDLAAIFGILVFILIYYNGLERLF